MSSSSSPNRIARLAVRNLLANESQGFNTYLAAALAEASIAPFAVDFGPGSSSFFMGALEPDSDILDSSQLNPEPLGLCLYTLGAVNSKQTNAALFSGLVEVRIDAYLKLRARNAQSPGVESDDTETPMDCVEEAIMQALHRPDDWAAGVVYNFDWKSDRSPLLLFEDGYQQRVSIALAVGVRV